MKKRSLATLMALMLIVIIFNTLPFSTPAAGSDELKRELLGDIISVDKPGLFDDYGELDLAKAKVQAVLQGMEGWAVTPNTKAWVNIFLGIIDDFERMADLSKSSVPSEHIKALEIAEGINRSINALSGYDIAERNGIPMFSEIALRRFYRNEGEFFEEAARNEEETKVKIEHARNSSSAYELGGRPTEKSRMEFESRRLDWMYKRDMERASEYITASWSHRENADKPSPGFFDTAAAFMEIIKARDSFEEAKKIYEKHEDRELENVKGIESKINDTYKGLMQKTIKNIAFYLLILSFFTVIIGMDFKRWGEELDDTMLGVELIG